MRFCVRIRFVSVSPYYMCFQRRFTFESAEGDKVRAWQGGERLTRLRIQDTQTLEDNEPRTHVGYEKPGRKTGGDRTPGGKDMASRPSYRAGISYKQVCLQVERTAHYCGQPTDYSGQIAGHIQSK